MGARTVRELAESYWAAEERRDVDAIVAHYHPDATYQDGGGRRRGLDEIRAFYRTSAADHPAITVRILEDYPVEGGAAVEFHAELTDPDGRTWVIEGVNLFRVRDDRFTSVRSYEDAPRLAGA